MSDFKGRHFGGEIVLWAVRWYCRYGISYRDLEQMMAERGVLVDHTTIYRWVQQYAVRPDGADHQWRRVPPRELSIALVADERFGRVTGWIEAS
jgi:IS6 family transposase